MANKLKSIMEILEEEKKKKDAENIEKIYTKSDNVFLCNKQDSSSFKYVEPEYLLSDYEIKKETIFSCRRDSYLKSYSKSFEHGKETISLYLLISKYRSDCAKKLGSNHPPHLNLNRVQKLINKGANVNFTNNNLNNDSCLLQAIESRNIDLINLLLNNGANPNIKQHVYTDWRCPILCLFVKVVYKSDEKSPLLQVFTDMVEKYGADINMKDVCGRYQIVGLVTSKTRTQDEAYAKKILEHYGFTEEDYNNKGSYPEDNTNKKNNVNVKSKEDEEFIEKFEKEFSIPENL